MSSKNKNKIVPSVRKYGNPELNNQIETYRAKEEDHSISEKRLSPVVPATKVVKNIQPKHSSVKQRKKKSYKQLSVYMNKQEFELLNKLSEELGLKKSQLFRIALRNYAKKINLE